MVGSYHKLWRIEKSFRMSKSDLAARSIYRRTRDSIDAHLTIVFAALAVTWIVEARTGWSIKKFVTTARRYRAVTIQAGTHTINAADPYPPTPYPPTSTTPSRPSAVDTNLSQVRLLHRRVPSGRSSCCLLKSATADLWWSTEIRNQ